MKQENSTITLLLNYNAHAIENNLQQFSLKSLRSRFINLQSNYFPIYAYNIHVYNHLIINTNKICIKFVYSEARIELNSPR